MFTGIIEETGVVKALSKHTNGAVLTLECNKVLSDTKIGDSIAINGVCQTVIDMSKNTFSVDVSDETLDVTTFKNFKSGEKVNLERALTLSTRLGGHMVTGHIDCRGKLLSIQRLSNFYNLEFELPEQQMKYVVNKGSIAINGISLTVAKVEKNIVKAAIIPHTFQNTTLQYLNPGDYVNIETDILAKYVENFSCKEDNDVITIEYLNQNGFV